MFQSDSLAAYFNNDSLHVDTSSAFLSKCNQFGRFPILPLSPHMALSDGNLSDDSCSPVTPLDAYNLSLHTMGFQKMDQLQSPFSQHCLPMSALYIPPRLASDIESSSPSASPVSIAAPLPTAPAAATFLAPIVVPSQPQTNKRESPTLDSFPSRPVASAAKKPRLAAERIRSKDFIPPDTSGLTKREARLVKNRAAAFLSRQRKREEFEAMEARLADLETEKQRIIAVAQGTVSPAAALEDNSAALQMQVSSLKSMLSAADEREEALKAELEQLRADSASGSQPRSPSPCSQKDKSAAVMILMSLSSLISPLGSSSDGLQDLSIGGAWQSTSSGREDLSFDSTPEFDVSCSPSADGKVRVRIHRPSSSRSTKIAEPTWSSSHMSMLPFDAPRNDYPFMDDMNDSLSGLFDSSSIDAFGFPSRIDGVTGIPVGGSRRMRVSLANASLREDGAELVVEVQ